MFKAKTRVEQLKEAQAGETLPDLPILVEMMLFVGCKLAFGGEMSELCKKCSAKSESNFIGRQTCFFFKR